MGVQRWWLLPGERPDWEFLHPSKHWKGRNMNSLDRIHQLPDFTVDVEQESKSIPTPCCPNPKCGNLHFFEKAGTREFSYCPECHWTAEDLKQYLLKPEEDEFPFPDCSDCGHVMLPGPSKTAICSNCEKEVSL